MEEAVTLQAQLAALLEDDGEALDAAFAFLNEWPDDDRLEAGSTTDDSDSSNAKDGTEVVDVCDAPTAATLEPSPPQTGRPTPQRRGKSTVDRRKDELKQLKTEAVDLEARLAVLRAIAAQKKGVTSRLLSRSGLPASQNRLRSADAMLSMWMLPEKHVQSQRVAIATLWKDMALRHQKLRTASEAENARLRRLIAGQRKTITSIRNLIRRQIRNDRQNQPEVVSIRSIGGSNTSDDMRTLERLRLEAERHSHAILTSQSDWSAVSPTSQICQLSPTKTSVVFVEQQVMPFHFQDVSEVVWESMKQHCVKHDQWFKQSVVEKSEALLMRVHCIEHQAGYQHIKMSGHTAVHRTIGAKQGGFAFSGVSRLLELNGTALAGISIREHGLANIASIDGPSSTAMCQLTMVHQIEIEINPALSHEAPHVDAIAQMYAAKHPDSFRHMLVEIESAVLQRQTRAAAS